MKRNEGEKAILSESDQEKRGKTQGSKERK